VLRYKRERLNDKDVEIKTREIERSVEEDEY